MDSLVEMGILEVVEEEKLVLLLQVLVVQVEDIFLAVGEQVL